MVNHRWRRRAGLQATWLATRAAGALSARAAGPFAARLWFTPWSPPAAPEAHRRESAWLAGSRPLTVSAGDHTLTGFVAGAGPTILLVHGWGDRAARLGAFIGPLVTAGHRVVGVDLPGHGDGAGQTNGYELAAALLAVGKHLGGLHGIVAHSMGALVTTKALSDGLDARSVALIAPAVRLEHALERFTTQLRLPPKAGVGLRGTIEERFGPEVWTGFAGDRIAKDLSVPALIVHDEVDQQVDVVDAKTLAAAWPDAQLVTTQGLGHRRILRDRGVIDRAVSFLR